MGKRKWTTEIPGNDAEARERFKQWVMTNVFDKANSAYGLLPDACFIFAGDWNLMAVGEEEPCHAMEVDRSYTILWAVV